MQHRALFFGVLAATSALFVFAACKSSDDSSSSSSGGTGPVTYTDASKDVFVVSSTPNANGSAWLGTIQNNNSSSVQVGLTAACVTAG